MIVLAGDIGGTNARVAIVEIDAGSARVLQEAKYHSADFPGLSPIVQLFRDATDYLPERACYGIAGPVIDQTCHASNLPWTLDARVVARETGIARTTFINDFDAVGYGVARLGAADVVTLQPGTHRPTGPIALIGAGTGLGQGFLLWDGARYRAYGSEGGHVAFAARDALEWGLVESLHAEFGHVSYERVLSGSGLGHVYRYLLASGFAPEADDVHVEMAVEDPAAVVTRHALAGTDALCSKTLDLFVAVFGRQAGHLAITVLAYGGVYVAGGIAPRIIPRLTDGAFMTSFRDQGRISAVAAEVPVHVIINPEVGLLGAASAAFEGIVNGGAR